MVRQRVPVAFPWGDAIGYSRAVRAGGLVFVSGTTASGPDGKALHSGDVGAQAAVILERIATALRDVGSRLEDVVELRIYLTSIADWQEVGRAHGQAFGKARPATTMVQVGPLVAPDLLVEIAATAVVPEPSTALGA